jgi:flavin-dependent dehydrogenase
MKQEVPKATTHYSADEFLKPATVSADITHKLQDGARVAVIGGGPSGSFFAIFLLAMAQELGLSLNLDIFEPRDFHSPAPRGCNMCGGIISETLVQYLATEGINLPPSVVQRGIDSYTMHTDAGTVRIKTPLDEKRIAAVHRGAGPRDLKETKWLSFDGFLLDLAKQKGACVQERRVRAVRRTENGRLVLSTGGPDTEPYDLIGVAVGVNSAVARLFPAPEFDYQPPQTTKTAIREYYLGQEQIERYLGSSMHVFLLDVPRLEFAAVIPKGDYATVCLLGEEIDNQLLEDFLQSPEVRECFPPDWNWQQPSCFCSPRINVQGARPPYADRLVFLGDCGTTRLYKDGIGAAYRAAKSAATTALYYGVSSNDFGQHYWPACKAIASDNTIGKVIFLVVRQIQRWRFSRTTVLRMVASEENLAPEARRMSTVLWDTFTGSAPYLEVFKRTLHPAFLLKFVGLAATSLWQSITVSKEGH